MARSNQTFSKKEKEERRRKKKKEKEARKEERRANSENNGSLESMMAYVDEFGNIVDTPPDPDQKKEEVDASTIELGIPKKEDIAIEEGAKTGRVDFFNSEKGYGFIKEIGTGQSFFYHINGTLEEVNEGDKVSFELEQGPKGLNAVKVKKA